MSEIILPNNEIITPSDIRENHIILPNGSYTGDNGERLAQIDLVSGGALGTSKLNLIESPTDSMMAEADFKNPRQLEELRYIIKDVLAGDPSAARDERFSYLNFDQVKTAIEWIMTNSFDDGLQQLLLEKPWLLTFKNKPPTPEEFLTHKYIGSMADSIWTPVRKNFVQYFDPLKPCRNGILNPAIGSGKPCPYQSHIKLCCKIYDIVDDDGTEYHIPANADINILVDGKPIMIKALELESLSSDFDWNGKKQLYKYMKNYDVSNFERLNFSGSSYDELISFFKNIEDSYYEKNNIYTQRHHIIPTSEGGNDDASNMIRLPYKYHMMAHYFRGKEAEAKNDKLSMYKNFKAVKFSLKENSIPKEIKDFSSKIDFVVESIQHLEKSHIWVTNGSETIRIFEFELDNYPGYRRGRTFKSPATKKWMNKDGKNYYVEKEKIQEFLDDGYSLGMFKTEKMKNANRTSYSTKGTKWMNKDGVNKAVEKDLVEQFKKDGWVLGHVFENVISKAKTRKMVDTNGKVHVVRAELFQEKLSQGWKFGGSSQ